MYDDLRGKVALVTGGCRGLGREMVLALAAAGCDVVVTSRKVEACRAVAELAGAAGVRAHVIGAHLGHWEELDPLVDEAYDAFGRLDILINNAGKSPLYESLTAVNEELFDSVLALNLKAPFRLGALCGARMWAAGGGVIINVSSVIARDPAPHALPYACAKAGLEALTVGLARAYAPLVRVNAIVPGAFRTDVSRAWTPEVVAHMEAATLAGRIGEPSEIAPAALFLASDASGYVNGALLTIDGGRVGMG